VTADARLSLAADVLRAHGFAGTVSAEGQEGEIAAIRVGDADWERIVSAGVAEMTGEMKRLGFRYLTVDLLPLGE
jgi:hypothetical protein